MELRSGFCRATLRYIGRRAGPQQAAVAAAPACSRRRGFTTMRIIGRIRQPAGSVVDLGLQGRPRSRPRRALLAPTMSAATASASNLEVGKLEQGPYAKRSDKRLSGIATIREMASGLLSIRSTTLSHQA